MEQTMKLLSCTTLPTAPTTSSSGGGRLSCSARPEANPIINVEEEGFRVMSKTVLILGVGVGGLTTTAGIIRRLLPSEDRIILAHNSFDGTLGLSVL
ncbi:hypothetical protein [Mycobacterium pseudokansasii]